MEIRIQRLFLSLLMALVLSTISKNSLANDSTTPLMTFQNEDEQGDIAQVDVEKREVLEDILDHENFEIGLQFGVLSVEDFESNVSLSAHFSYHITELFYAKAMYLQSEAGMTSFEKLANVPPLLTEEERKLSYYGLNIGYNLMPGEVFLGRDLAFNSVFSIELGGGTTSFAGEDNFTVNLGANYRVFLTDWITWDIGMSDFIFDSKITGESKTTHNLNFTTGVAFYF